MFTIRARCISTLFLPFMLPLLQNLQASEVEQYSTLSIHLCLHRENVILSNFPPQSFQSYQEAVNSFLFAGELTDFNIAKLNYSALTLCEIPAELLWTEMDIKLHKQYSLGPFTPTAPRVFRYNYSHSCNGAGFKEFVTAFEVSKTIWMAELQFELQVLRSSFYIK